MTVFVCLFTTHKTQKAAGLRSEDFFFRDHLVSRRKYSVCGTITFFLKDNLCFFGDQRCQKAASQCLSYSISAKTSVHFCTFSGAYVEGKKLEGTLVTTPFSFCVISDGNYSELSFWNWGPVKI